MTTLAEVTGASLGVALLAIITLEGGTYMVLFAPRRIAKLRQEGREKGLQEGREEGLQEGRDEGRQLTIQEYQEFDAEMKAWFERHREARANNQPFDKPPPVSPANNR